MQLRRYATAKNEPERRKLTIYRSKSNDPIFNLAAEEYLFSDALDVSNPKLSHQILYLWQNGPCVIIGRHQNPWNEARVTKMEKDKLTLARRFSGGGAVYQDLGNGLFSFIGPKNDFDIARNMEIVVRALKRFGLTAEYGGRNDITIASRKVSGSAFKHTKDRSIQHGTLLFDVNMEHMQKYLTPSKLKLESKGIESVVSRVANLKELAPEMTFEQLNKALEEEFQRTYTSADAPEIKEITPDVLKSSATFHRNFKQLQDWEFRFGWTPEFKIHMEKKFDWALFDVHIKADKGRINDAKLFSDALNPAVVEEIEKKLKGAGAYTKGSLDAALNQAKVTFKGNDQAQRQVDEFKEWLLSTL